MKQLNKKEEKLLDDAFSAICNMYFASHESNHSLCGSFHILPFNTHWDKKTVEELMYHVKLYIGSWVISPMEQILVKTRNDIENARYKDYHESEKRRKKYLKNQSK